MNLASKKWQVIGAGVLIALVVASPFAWRAVKQARAQNLMVESQTLLEEAMQKGRGHFEAREAAKAAYELAPDNLAVARNLAEIENLAAPLSAPKMWETIYEQSGEEADLLAWFDSYLRTANKEAVNDLAQQLAEQFPDSPNSLHRRAQNAFIQGDFDTGLALLGQAARTPGASDEVQFYYVQVSQKSDDAVVREAGINWLRQMARRPDEAGLKAARSLLTAPGQSRDELLKAAQSLTAHPKAEREDKLQEIVIRGNANQTDIEALLAEVRPLFNLDDPAELVELGRWFNQQSRPRDFLKLVDLETALQRQDLFLVWADAMSYTGNWAELEQVFRRPSIPLEPYIQVLFLARIQHELGQEEVSTLTWNRALISAKEDIDKLQYAYDYARKLQWRNEAREVLLRLTKIPASKQKAYVELVDFDNKSGDVAALQETLVAMRKEFPDQPEVINDLAYVNLLLGQNAEQAIADAQRLREQSPAPQLANIITLALGLYRIGQPEAALDALYPLAINWDEVKPGWRAIYAAILAANGYQHESQNIMEGVNPENLLPEERAILQAARSAAKGS